MRTSGHLILVFLAFFVVACASTPVTQVNVQSVELQKEGIPTNTAIARVIDVLVDRGFDLKMSNADSGIVTTEYEKFASVGDDPPFDFYLQIRARVRQTGSVTSVSLSPAIREQNRRNSAAFTDQELSYFEGEPENVGEIASMQGRTGWRSMANALFMNVAADTADAFGVSVEELTRNVSRTFIDAGDVEN